MERITNARTLICKTLLFLNGRKCRYWQNCSTCVATSFSDASGAVFSNDRDLTGGGQIPGGVRCESALPISRDAVRVDGAEQSSAVSPKADSRPENLKRLRKKNACFILVRLFWTVPMLRAAEMMAASSVADAPAICCVPLCWPSSDVSERSRLCARLSVVGGSSGASITVIYRSHLDKWRSWFKW